jgi:hypothetical protein
VTSEHIGERLIITGVGTANPLVERHRVRKPDETEPPAEK